MKKFILGFLSALGVIGTGYFIYDKGLTNGIKRACKLEEYVSKRNRGSE